MTDTIMRVAILKVFEYSPVTLVLDTVVRNWDQFHSTTSSVPQTEPGMEMWNSGIDSIISACQYCPYIIVEKENMSSTNSIV